MCPSGTGRFIADSWFSDDPLPLASHCALGGQGTRDLAESAPSKSTKLRSTPI